MQKKKIAVQRKKIRGIAVLLGATTALCLGACVPMQGGWDARALEQRYPQLAEQRGQRLGDTMPYFTLEGDGLALFLCRWRERTIAVRLPADASSAERELLGLALSAWEGASLGLDFRIVDLPDETPFGVGAIQGIEIEYADGGGSESPGGSGNTICDCAIPIDVADADPELPIDARLRYASIRLRRTRPDALGRTIALSREEMLGAATHELGHALGFPGHVAGGGSVVSAHGQLDAARRWGRRLQTGERLHAPTLRALYALPSGVRVGSLELSPGRLAQARTLAAAALARGLRGPFARVGGESARIFWRDPEGHSSVLAVPGWPEVLRDPALFSVRVSPRARALLR